MQNETRLDIARRQIEFARTYSMGLVADVDDRLWFQQPAEGVTHLAWQVGHLAVAEYGLGLFRLRGRAEGDGQLLPSVFRRRFGKGTTPDPNPENNPTPAAIREVLARVHQQVFDELPRYTESDLDVPCDEPHALFETKMGALFFCSIHEMMHAGQIGLLRRLLGRSTLR